MIRCTSEKNYSAVIRGKKKQLTLLTEHWMMHGTPGRAAELGSRLTLKNDAQYHTHNWLPGRWPSETLLPLDAAVTLLVEPDFLSQHLPVKWYPQWVSSSIYPLWNPSVSWMSLIHRAQGSCLCPCYQERLFLTSAFRRWIPCRKFTKHSKPGSQVLDCPGRQHLTWQ